MLSPRGQCGIEAKFCGLGLDLGLIGFGLGLGLVRHIGLVLMCLGLVALINFI